MYQKKWVDEFVTWPEASLPRGHQGLCTTCMMNHQRVKYLHSFSQEYQQRSLSAEKPVHPYGCLRLGMKLPVLTKAQYPA